MERKISFINEDNYKYLVYEAEGTARKNHLAIHMAENNEFPQLLEVYFSEDGRMRGEYDITECRAFMDCLPEKAGRDDIFPLLEKMLFIIKALRTDFISEPDLLLRKEYIYIDNNTSMIRFAAVPEILEENNSVTLLISDILENINWKVQEKKTYLDLFIQVLKEKNVSYDRLLEVIKQIMNEPLELEEPEPVMQAAPEIPPQPQPVPAMQPAAPVQPIASVQQAVPVQPAPPVQPVPQPPVPPAYQPASDGEGYEGSFGETTVLGISSQPMIFPVLIRIKNNEKVVVSKMEFLIGKDPARVDYCIFDNSAVSRVHARIISRNGEFFVVDNRSTNHVYVNGMLIDANVEVRLTHGSRVRLGDEDFEFRFQ